MPYGSDDDKQESLAKSYDIYLRDDVPVLYSRSNTIINAWMTYGFVDADVKSQNTVAFCKEPHSEFNRIATWKMMSLNHIFQCIDWMQKNYIHQEE